MGTRALRVYCFRGIYYCIMVSCDGYPTGEGKRIVAEIPAEPEAFKAWKQVQIKHYEEEAKRDLGLSDDDDPYSPTRHGGYFTMPSRAEPSFRVVQWIYVVNLDNDTISVAQESGGRRIFRLENIPRFLFERDEGIGSKEEVFCGDNSTMTASISRAFLAGPGPDAKLDEEYIGLFQHCSLRSHTVAKLSEDDPLNPWCVLRLQLLSQFLTKFKGVLTYLRSPEIISEFSSAGLDDLTTLGSYRYRQISWGILNILDPATGIKFQREKLLMPRLTSTPGVYWEAPAKAHYWVGDVFVVLEPRLHILEHLYSAIWKAVRIVKASDLKNRPIVSAIIFSIESFVIVDINCNGNQTEISCTRNLVLGEETDCHWMSEICQTGFVTLLNLFSTHVPQQLSPPGRLPTELCIQIFNYSSPPTQQALAVSCRAFRSIALRRPRIGEWEIFSLWRHRISRFVASRGAGLAKCVIHVTAAGIEQCERGFPIGIFRDSLRIDLGLSGVSVEKSADSGHAGCKCCAGLPVQVEYNGVAGNGLMGLVDWP